MLFLLYPPEGEISKNVILTIVSRKQILRKRHPYYHLQKVGFPKTLSLLSFPESRISKNIILALISRK